MKLPDKVKISGLVFDVIYKDRSKDGTYHLGSSLEAVQKIWIDNFEVSLVQQGSTLLHEIIEMINSMNDLELDHQQISVLGTSLWQVLVDNEFLK